MGRFQSYSAPFQWDDIPMFAVLSGENGSGKTHLLRLIQAACGNAGLPPGVVARHTKGTVPKQAVVYAFGQLRLEEPAPVAQQQVLEQLRSTVQQLKQPGTSRSNSPQVVYAAGQLERAFAGKVRSVPDAELSEALPVDWNLPREPNPSGILSALAVSFYRYHLRRCQVILRGAEEGRGPLAECEIVAEVGEPPWNVVNEMLGRAGFNHRVTTPTMVSFDDRYQLEFVRQEDGVDVRVSLSNLSSGEQTMLALACLMYNSEKVGVSPKLLLLDEPDAHLHPANLAGYIGAIQDILVAKHGVRVIMTTHRPDTVASAPEQALYVVSRKGDRVRKAPSKVALVSALSANALAVLPNARCVWVEDDDDRDFYTLVRGLLGVHQEFRDVTTLSFQSANLGKVGGGANQVKAWVGRLQQAGLGHMVQGLIDRDAGNTPEPSLFVIDRYSHENYLLDPLVIFAALLDAGRAPQVPGIALHPGDEHKLWGLSKNELERIANAVLGPLGAHVGAKDTGTFEVEFVGHTEAVSYPQWLRDTRGHDLQAASFKLHNLALKDLRKAFGRLRLVPKGLAELLRAMTAS